MWQGQGLKLAINGQTGRVAVKVKQQIKTRPFDRHGLQMAVAGHVSFCGFNCYDGGSIEGVML